MQGQTEFSFDESEVEWYTGVDEEEEDDQKLLTQYNLSPSQFTEFAVFLPVGGNYNNFSFEGRGYLRQIYDTPTNRRIIIAGSQVEKRLNNSTTYVSCKDGQLRRLGDVKEGDLVAALEQESHSRMSSGRVDWTSSLKRRPCLRITTRQGHFVEPAKTHPFLRWNRWVNAEDLKVGDRVAVVRRCGGFIGSQKYNDSRIRITANLIGDGGLGSGVVFTQCPGSLLAEFLRDLRSVGGTWRTEGKDVTSSLDIRIHDGTVHQWMKEDGLLGTKSAGKFVPPWVFGLNRSKTSRFLNRLWATDGHVKQNTRSKYSLEYCSISERLVTDVQALLWKFGVPSKIRSFVPELYKERLDEHDNPKVAYILRIETQEGVRRFLTEIAALGKSEEIPLPEADENNNRDTYPIDVNEDIEKILESRGSDGWHENRRGSLYSWGLRRTLKYPPTKRKLAEYVDFFRATPGFDQELVDRLEAHLNTDLYWDEVIGIEDIGERDCIDFSIEEHHNFVANGFVTHNSTLLGNQILAYCVLNPGFRALYVSPSHTQTKVFSRDRIKEPIETSHILKGFTTSKLLSNVLEKKFVNRSQVTLRFAFLNADRCIAGDSLVQMEDGRSVPIRDLAAWCKSAWVMSADETGSAVPARAHSPRSNGVREVVELRTGYPVPIKVTPDHHVLTHRGWVEAQELREGDYIAAPHFGEHLDEGESIGEDVAWLIGAMTAEGECSDPCSVRFTNTDEEYFLEFVERATRYGIKLGKVGEDNRYDNVCYSVALYADTRGPGIDGAKKALWDLGEFGQKSVEKYIPASILRATSLEQAAYLKALFQGDGWCVEEGGVGRSGYSTSSRLLAEQLCHLLWGLGIRTSLRTRPPSTQNAQESYCIDFSTSATTKLVSFIGQYRPVETYRNESLKDIKDRIPVSYGWLRQHLKEKHGLSTHSAWAKYRIQLRPGNHKDSIGRRVLFQIAQKLDDSLLKTLSDPSRSWVEVHEVAYAGEEEVFDLTVDTTESFIANGIVVHNCRGIPADYVLIDEFQDILLENVPVIEECASHSEYRFFTYSGTPKSLDNPLEFYYRRFSTQNEWAVPCKRHGVEKDPSTWHWNILDEHNIGKKGLICDKCRKPISAADPDCQWAALNPKPNVERPFEGFRIPQLMVPWIDWADILDKQRKYSRSKFYNEVLGLSYDSGVRPLTQADVKDNCNPKLSMRYYKKVAEKYKAQMPVFMGLDWGCHDEETRVLTENGWKYFRDLNEGEKVAQFDKDTREMAFVDPEVLTVRDWNEPLYHLESRQLDMALSGPHRILAKTYRSKKDKWFVEPCSDLAERRSKVVFRGWVEWRGEEIEEFTLPGLPSSAGYPGCGARAFDMDDWLEFLGYYLSEGGLCWDRSGDVPRPSCLKMSQRLRVNPETGRAMKELLDRMEIEHSVFMNTETTDQNITIYGKQFWLWILENVGGHGHVKRLPRKFLRLSKRQLGILLWAMMDGDGSVDKRPGCTSGSYTSTSRGLCEDVQELAIRLGYRAIVSKHREAYENRKTQWRVSISGGGDHVFSPEKIERRDYKGKVYCCKVPSGFIVTERNGRVAYQGNTGENTFTVVTLGGYLPWAPKYYTIFYAHRFEGLDSEPKRQLEKIRHLIEFFNVAYVGADYGGGHWPNDELVRDYGSEKVKRYQWVGNVKVKIKYEPGLTIPRYLCHRTEVMSDLFNAIKRRDVFRFPRWQEWEDPFAADMLNIFSEYNERLRMNVYKRGPGMPDDTYHSIVFGFLASFHYKRRADIVAPTKEVGRVTDESLLDMDIDL